MSATQAHEVLEIRKVSKTFAAADGKSIAALEDVSFAARPAEIVSLVGPSGCGKSTLLRMVAGFDFPSSGQLLLGAAGISGPAQERGIVFQQPQLYPWLTVFDNVAFGPRMRGTRKDAYTPAADDYIRAVGLAGFEKHYPYQLSGGMKQRVQIARVLINEPRVLLMDEPFGALDYQNRLVMQRLLLDLAAQYRPTVLFITHDVEEAIFLSDTVHVMSARPGRIVETLQIGLARPRVYEEVSGSGDFVRAKLHILKLLQH
ncbi:MAG: ABC transporter ATP-binding protein [Betaproteobacteria bacterium]